MIVRNKDRGAREERNVEGKRTTEEKRKRAIRWVVDSARCVD